MHSTLTDVSGNEVVPRDIALHETVLVSTADLDVDSGLRGVLVRLRYLGARALCAQTEPRRVREYKMESKTSEPCEGENIIYSHTPDGHERAELSSAAVAGSGSELRPVPACLNGACTRGGGEKEV